MTREDWNYVALLTMANLFAGIVSTIYKYITGNSFKFIMFFLVYTIFYGIVTLLFNDTGVLDRKHTALPLIIYVVLAFVAGLISFVIQNIIGRDINDLVMYIVLAILGVVVCGISKIFAD